MRTTPLLIKHSKSLEKTPMIKDNKVSFNYMEEKK
jgi:hypothetical protein